MQNDRVVYNSAGFIWGITDCESLEYSENVSNDAMMVFFWLQKLLKNARITIISGI